MSSKSPNKQRKAAANASLHTQRKRLRARCLDPNYLNIRNVTIRVGDEVEIHRGDFGHPNSQKGEKGKRHGEARGKSGLAQRLPGSTQDLATFSSRVLHIPRPMGRKREFLYTLPTSSSSRSMIATPSA